MTVNAYGGSGEAQGRDGACTPKWLAELIGEVDLDPCSNTRSHIRADLILTLEAGDDGIYEDADGCPGWYTVKLGVVQRMRQEATRRTRTFINPPYARGQVIRWVRHYKHTRFIFLLRYDPSTEWYEELLEVTDYVWHPRRRRIEFEPPPGVEFSSNPFPHALFLRDPSPELLERLRSAGYLLDVRGARGQSGEHGHRQGSDSSREGEAEAAGAGAGGGGIDGVIARLREYCQERSTPGRAWGFDEAEWRTALEWAWTTACDSAGGEVPGPAPRRQRVRGNRRRSATGNVGGGEVGAQRDEGEGDGGLPQR